MTRRRYNVVQLIIIIAAVAILFAMPIFKQTVIFDEADVRSVKTMYGSVYTKNTSEINPNFYHYSVSDAFGVFVAYLPHIFLGINFILTAVAAYKGNEHKNSFVHIIAPSLSFICFVVTSVLLINTSYHTFNGTATDKLYTGFWVFVAVSLINIAISVLKCIDKFVAKPKAKLVRVENANNISCADELKKFKELLDAGIITAEEFEEKKKQLLK